MNLLFAIPLTRLTTSFRGLKILFLGGWFTARRLAYLAWPLWATVFGFGAFVGLM